MPPSDAGRFNEGMGCDPCWDQIGDMEKDDRFRAMNVELISVMVDAPFDMKPEAEKRELTSIVAADVNLQASKHYGALGKSMHPGIKPGHSFILVDTAGTIAWRWDWTEERGPMYVDVQELDKQIARALNGG